AERATPELARAALYSLASLELPPAVAPRLRKIALGREPERALLAIERLAQIPGAAGADGLASVLSSTNDRGRAEAAATAVGARAILRLLGQSADATADDGYALAAAELAAGRRDEALVVCGQLLDRGFDLAAALRKDRQLGPEQRYQLGFALVERRNPAGEE